MIFCFRLKFDQKIWEPDVTHMRETEIGNIQAQATSTLEICYK